MQRGTRGQARAASPAWPQRHRRVAFLPWVKISIRRPKRPTPPSHPKTLGEHILAARINRKLRQKDVASELGVCDSTLLHWEKGTTSPPVVYYPAILKFLGYDPRPTPKKFGEFLVHLREALGLSRRRFAVEIGIAEETLAKWEKANVSPAVSKFAAKLERLRRLGSDTDGVVSCHYLTLSELWK
ncbi:helix-turn-helix transcriptional regulator [Parvibaculum sp.]|uniref:helix-turn-helix transcriptional regulator n=1 Tax=Parvibaculum sp. TaxID=2024848 RepID=UPI0034128DF5|nr:transcriptional regulator [Parvibaculum sp.]